MASKVDFQSTYPWITKELFQRILAKEFSTHIIKVEKYTISAAVPDGENFASIMIRVIVQYLLDNSPREYRFVIKALHYKDEIKAMTGEMQCFKREIYNYKFVLPAVHKLLAEIGDDTKVAAKCFDASDENEYIIFEDLLAHGYKLAPKKIGLDIEHFKCVLNKVAKWHATTLVLEERGTLPLSIYFKTHCMNNTKTWQDLSRESMETATIVLKTKLGYEKLAEKTEKLITNLYDKVLKSIDCDDQTFISLCHGDLWCSNIMFAYDDETNQPSDALLLDYQISFWGPAIIDVVNTLYSSSHEDLREKDWDHLLQFYHQQLIETFEKLNYSKIVPTLTEIQAQFILKGISNIPIALMATGYRKYEEHQVSDFTELSGDQSLNSRCKMMSNPNAWKQYEFLFDYFDRKGYFD